MPKRLVPVLAAAVALAGASGCITVKAYVDPTLPKVGAADLAIPASPRPVAVVVHFQRNGEPKENVAPEIGRRLVASLEASRVFSKVTLGDDPTVDRIVFTMNNVADTSGAVGKGIGTGLTFGLAGSVVTDGYEFRAAFYPAGQGGLQWAYRHAIHSAIGNTEVPGLTPMPLDAAVTQVVREVAFVFVRDVQKAGLLGAASAPAPTAPAPAPSAPAPTSPAPAAAAAPTAPGA